MKAVNDAPVRLDIQHERPVFLEQSFGRVLVLRQSPHSCRSQGYRRLAPSPASSFPLHWRGQSTAVPAESPSGQRRDRQLSAVTGKYKQLEK